MRARLGGFDGTEAFEGDLLKPDLYRRLFSSFRQDGPSIPRGAGLSYCAASSGEGVRSVCGMRFDRILGFDSTSGLISVEPGIRLGDLCRFSLPRGWVLPVMPGHPDITVGGCIGFNVHGKNQFREGNFRSALEELTLYHPDHGELKCSRTENSAIFDLTVGGFGLTGFVISARLRLKRIEAPTYVLRRWPVPDLVAGASRMKELAAEASALYSWHDLNGRRPGKGFVYEGVPAPDLDAPLRFEFPDHGVLDGGREHPQFFNRWTTALSLASYRMKEGAAGRESLLDIGRFLFPVAGKEFYFKLFGRGGFREYQVLFPENRWERAHDEVLRLIALHRAPITLASLKLFRGRASLLNFDGDGVCLSLDAPDGEPTQRFFADLDALTASTGGIVNISKDSRLESAFLRRIFPEYGLFRERLNAFDPKRRFDSALRRRLDV